MLDVIRMASAGMASMAEVELRLEKSRARSDCFEIVADVRGTVALKHYGHDHSTIANGIACFRLAQPGCFLHPQPWIMDTMDADVIWGMRVARFLCLAGGIG